MHYAVILAGGSGTRLWPLSRKKHPKQLRAVLGPKTLLAQTYERLTTKFESSRIFVSTCMSHANAVRAELPHVAQQQFIVEPEARGTAAAIGYVALRLLQHDTTATFVTINSDAYVENVEGYIQSILTARRALDHSAHGIVLIGVRPTYPETGYGYICCASSGKLQDGQVVQADRFVEKPDALVAKEYVQSGTYLWNPAIFTFDAVRVLEHFTHYLPLHAEVLASIGDTQDVATVARAFKEMPSTSIDVGLMEHLDGIDVIPESFGWADVGHWRAVHEILAGKSVDHVVQGVHVSVASRGNLVASKPRKVVATVGVENLVIIDTDDALLVCHRDRAQDVRGVIHELTKRGLETYL
jgi:mannose-1-phosphate guanylyltransferase